MLYLGHCPTKTDLIAECRKMKVPYSGKNTPELKTALKKKYSSMPMDEPSWLKEAEKMLKSK
tara:strand:+ start:857 stop:1042 length:186 start_codon:yes stop_codon:yes gene_type:complete